MGAGASANDEGQGSPFLAPSTRKPIIDADRKLRALERKLQESGGEWSLDETNEVRALVKVLQDELEVYLGQMRNTVADLRASGRLEEAMDKLSRAYADDKIMYEIAKKKADMEEADWSFVDEHAKTTRGTVQQVCGDVVVLYQQGKAVQTDFVAAVRAISEKLAKGTELKVARMKHLYRTVEKTAFSLKFPDRADGVLDIVRCAFVCDTKAGMAEVYAAVVKDPAFEVDRVKQRWTEPTAAGWADLMVGLHLVGDRNRHVCEVQIIHKKMMLAREGLDAHEVYAKLRSASETLEKLEVNKYTLTVEESQATRDLVLKMKAANSAAKKDYKKLKALWAQITQSKADDVERASLKAALAEAEAAQNFDACEKFQAQLQALKKRAKARRRVTSWISR